MVRRMIPLVAGILCLVAPLQAVRAELMVSVTITGEIDEILPILEHLRQRGAGPGGAAQYGESMRLEVHSMHAGGEASMAQAEAPPQQAPAVGITNVVVEPPSINPGMPVTIRVQVNDPARVIDTLTARFAGAQVEVDLFDNGTGGDLTPDDGIWSASVLAPQNLGSGVHTLLFSAYDANGQPVMAQGPGGAGLPVGAAVQVEVVRAEPAPVEPPAPPAEAPVQAPVESPEEAVDMPVSPQNLFAPQPE
jgi:hypothetical protein